MACADVIPSRIEPESYAVEERLRDGSAIRIRAIRPDDKARLLEHFAGLSAEARYFRFFGDKRTLTAQDLAHFTELDFDRHVGLAATRYEQGGERFIGVARYVRKAAPSRAEIALAVLDRYQGEGIGPRLIQHLARIAHEHGITGFEADVRGDNGRMRAVLARSGCIIDQATDVGIIHFSLSCPEHPAPIANSEFHSSGPSSRPPERR